LKNVFLKSYFEQTGGGGGNGFEEMVLKRKVKRFKNLVVSQNGALKFINPNQPATPAARHSGIEKGRRIGGVGEGD